MTEYLLISTAVASMTLLIAFFLRSTRDAREECRMAARADLDSELWDEPGTASSPVSVIFSIEDERFVLDECDPRLVALFRRERKQLALRWIERKKWQAVAIMRKHREASRRAADLRPYDEMVLLLRYARLRSKCEFLAAAVWLAGPQGLRGLTEQANAVFHGVQRLNAAAGQNKEEASA